jgi:histidine triad (HIT) family protein
MQSHALSGYECPFCRLLRGVETDHNRFDDIVWRDELTTAFISPRWWPKNHGHVLVIPNDHVENLYEIDDDLLAAVSATAKRAAIALKTAYGCQGTSMRQHNEPAGNQDVWHLHLHVFPRYLGDDLYERHEQKRWASPEERAPYAAKLRAVLSHEQTLEPG